MTFTQGHALIIGVGSYQHEPRLNVPITVADAKAVAAVLCDPQYCGYPTEQVSVLSDATASRDGILRALDELSSKVSENDTVFLFFCGHGDYSDDGDYYLTSHDTRLLNGKVASGSGVRQAELITRLRAVKAKRLFIAINACHAGELGPVLGPYTGTPLPADTAAALLGTGEGRIIVTACREDQVSYIGRGSLSLFTQALVNGLQGKGTVGNHGYISAFDLYTYLYFTVSEAVQRQLGATQEPELTVLKGVGPFAVALYFGGTTLGEFDTSGALPKGVVREVSRADAAGRLQRYQQSNSGAGVAVIESSATDSPVITGSNNAVIRSGRNTIQSAGNVIQAGDEYVGGTKISVGNVTGTGIAIGNYAQAHVQQSDGDHETFVRAFAQVYTDIKRRLEDPKVDKEEITDTVKKIQQEAQKGEDANEYKLGRWLRNLADMADDIFKVTVAALTGPQTASASKAHKVAVEAKQERGEG